MRGMTIRGTLVLAALTLATPAQADERDYCPARPGLGTPACTISPGRVSAEIGLADWTLEEDPGTRTDTVLIGDALVRVGLTDTIEAQIGWSPYGHVRTRDKIAGTVSNASGVGDVLVGLKANLRHPDGSGVAIAVQPFATLPVGGSAIGAGDWGAGVVVPVSFDIGALSLQLSPELDAAVDADGNGRHIAYGSVIGLGFPVTGNLSGTVELQATRDDDPAGATTQAYASLSFGWMQGEDVQIDVGAVAGLNADSTDAEVYVGISRRF